MTIAIVVMGFLYSGSVGAETKVYYITGHEYFAVPHCAGPYSRCQSNCDFSISQSSESEGVISGILEKCMKDCKDKNERCLKEMPKKSEGQKQKKK